MTPTPPPSPTPEPADRSIAFEPADIRLDLKTQTMVIEWRDGQVHRHDLGALRRVCPCATCRQRRDTPQPAGSLPILTLPPGGTPVVTDARLMGHYAINLRWSDGHDTGIYEYRFLRRLGTDA